MNAAGWDNPTRRIGAPPDWDHEKQGICHTLEIVDHEGVMYSAWQPSEAELKRLNEGKPIILGIQGTVHPVVCLGVGQ